MLSQILQFISNNLNLAAAASLATIITGIITVYQFPSVLSRRDVNKLFDALKSGKSIATKAEVKYQIKCYVPPKFTCGEMVKTIQDLQKEIKKSNSKIVITGKPASGKTTTMRNLYCRLSRTRKCVYIQMSSIYSIEDFRQRVKEQNTHRRREDEPVIAFIDGADEALAFKLPKCKTAMETFGAMYLNGQHSEIYRVFSEYGLNLDGFVISLRLEFLENPKFLKEYADGNNRLQVYTIQKMENGDIIKIYKSLKVLRRLDRTDTISRHQDGRYPPLWEEWRYTRYFRKILESVPDSIFRYPMYARYAYRFMKEYMEQEVPYIENLSTESNMALSFRVLLDAIFKWEFHVYYGQKRSGKIKLVTEQKEEEEQFKTAMENCLKRVVEAMPMVSGQSNPVISRKCLEDILVECAYGEGDHLAIAHCVLSSDDKGQMFSFCHSTFYEYYLAQYLLETASYNVRKEFLLSSASSENLREMYYAFLCQNEQWRESLCGSIEGGEFNFASCLKLKEKEVLEIKDNPQQKVTEILSYLPIVPCFHYHGVKFTREHIEEMMDGDMCLSETGWKALEPAFGLALCDSIKDLDLRYLSLENVQSLHIFKNLKCLDIRLSGDCMSIVNDALKQIQGVSLENLYIYSSDGELCIKIQEALNHGEFHVEKIFVEAPEFSAAHLEIYRLKCEAETRGQKNRFYILIRTKLEHAKNEFYKDDKYKDLQVLKAVFELEADESGPLRLREQWSETDINGNATIWNGLSLAKCYRYLDSTDEDESAYQMFNRLEPYIEKKPSELSMHFGYAFGKGYAFKDTKRAREWLTFVNKYVSSEYSEIPEINVKMCLFRTCIYDGDKNLDDLKNEIDALIMKSPNYMDNSNYYWYLELCCVQLLKTWKKGTLPPKNLLTLLQKYRNESGKYAEKKKFFFDYFSAIYMQLLYMNQMEDTNKAEALLTDLTEVLPLVNQSSFERAKQARQIKYMEQKLYFLFVSGQKELAIQAANDLLEYPCRKNAIPTDRVKYIREHCEGGEELYASADKHKLWGTLWY